MNGTATPAPEVGERSFAMPVCPYCGNEATRYSQQEWYGRTFKEDRVLYGCWTCSAVVGSHPDGTPLGTMAGKELRRLRIEAHQVFDRIWLGMRVRYFPDRSDPRTVTRGMNRQKAYADLEAATGVKHIGESDEEGCRRVIEYCREISNRDEK